MLTQHKSYTVQLRNIRFSHPDQYMAFMFHIIIQNQDQLLKDSSVIFHHESITSTCCNNRMLLRNLCYKSVNTNLTAFCLIFSLKIVECFAWICLGTTVSVWMKCNVIRMSICAEEVIPQLPIPFDFASWWTLIVNTNNLYLLWISKYKFQYCRGDRNWCWSVKGKDWHMRQLPVLLPMLLLTNLHHKFQTPSQIM